MKALRSSETSGAIHPPTQRHIPEDLELELPLLWKLRLHDDVHKIPLLRHLTGHAVAQLVEALRYKSEGRGFDSKLCHYNFSLT
jgi:hypothetical protein